MIGRRDSIREIDVVAAGVTLRGSLGVPEGAVGLTIFAHGSGSSRHSPRNRYVAEALRARGIATLLFDLLTEQEELVDRLDASRRFDIELLARRLVYVTDWTRSNPTQGIAHLPLSYFGASTGAAAALVAASRRPEEIRAIVSRGGRPDLAGPALPAVQAPTLFIVGGHDSIVQELNRAAIAQMTAPTQLAIVPGASHLFEEPGALEDVALLASEWLVEHLVPSFTEPPHGAPQFRDRRSAGAQLAESLRRYAGGDTIVFGVPRGGMPVADEIARALDAPLDVWLVRKIGMPIQPDLGMGALSEGAALVLDPMLVEWSGASPAEIRSIVHRKADEIRRRARTYRSNRPPLDVRGKTAIVVDDGAATGSLGAVIRGARRRGAARVVVAVPVATSETVHQLAAEADEVVCLATPERLIAIDAWYQDFRQLHDDVVIAVLDEARRRGQRPKSDAARPTSR